MTKIDQIRAFNRFYARQIGLLGQVQVDDLSYTEARVLYEIGDQNDLSARKLVGMLGLDEGYISRIIKSLEKRGLIFRVQSPADARVNLLKLTEKGKQDHETLVNKADGEVRKMVSDLPEATVDQMLEALETVQGTLSWPDVPAPVIRGLRSGDVGWVAKRHGELYAAHQGFDLSFEALVAKIMSDFVGTSANPRQDGWIAETNGLRLGCIFVVEDDTETARIRLMLVEPFARGKGIGQSLVETAIKHARHHGFTKMVLWTQRDFKAACRLYERNGFQMKESTADSMFGREVVNQSWELIL